MLTPRPYQVDMARDVWRSMFTQGHDSVVAVAPTGTGKTVTGAFFTQKVLEHTDRNVMVVAHRREIINQTHKKLVEAGIDAGVIMAGSVYSERHRVQVASIDTLRAWAGKDWFEMPKIGLLWIDEAHRTMSRTYQELIDYALGDGAKLLGTTATPIRSDGVGLGRTFDHMVCSPPISWMIDNKYLVECRYKVGIIPDLSGVKLTAADYNQSQLESVMNQKLLIGDIVENWQKHAAGRPTMIFASGVSHSRHIVECFKEAGIRAEHIDGHTPKLERDRIAQRMLSGEVEVISNAQVYTEGTDIPWISCIVFAQPSKSLGKVLQQGGRGMRPFEGKTDCIYLDHAGVVHAHGTLEMNREWRLVEGKEMVDEIKQQREKEKVMFECDVCHEMFRGPECPSCHTEVQFKGNAKNFLPAELVDLSQAEFDSLMKPKTKKKTTDYTVPEKKRFYQELLGYTKIHGKNPGYAYHLYVSKFGVKPCFSTRELAPVEPGDVVKSYCHSRRIAYAKAHSSIRPKGMFNGA